MHNWLSLTPFLVAFLIFGGLGLIGGLFGSHSRYLNPFPHGKIRVPKLHFGCKKDNYQVYLDYWSPDNPPTCPTCGEVLTGVGGKE